MTISVRRKVALVIGSGGIKTAASIGVVRALQEEGIEIEMVVGTSGGAVFGAAIALGYSADEITEIQYRMWTEDVISRVNIRKVLSVIAPKLFRFDERFAIFDDRIINRRLEEVFGAETTFADTKIPFYCIATDFFTGRSCVLSHGPLARALRVSSGIPIVYGAGAWEDRLLIDGALSDPLPVDVAIREGADVIIALGFETAIERNVASIGHFANQTFNILVNQLMLKKIAFYNLAHHSEVIVVVPEFDGRIRVNDVDRVPYIIEQGEKEIRKHIPYLRRLLGSSTA